jgi:endogenous inhibitor of DNA gyrase (YacG/DUF329 family)
MPVTKRCDQCGELVSREPSRMKSRAVFCSRTCRDAWMRRSRTLPCEQCGAEVTRARSLFKGRVFCGKECKNAGLTKASPTARRNLYRPDHPLAGERGYIAEHRAVLYEKIGSGEHPCHWCGKNVRWTRRLKGTGHAGMLVADHVNSDEHDNRPENLVPACQGCNGTRWHRIEEGEPFVVRRNGKRLRAVVRSCEQCGGEFLAAAYEVRNGKGRFCSMSCARKQPRTS